MNLQRHGDGIFKFPDQSSCNKYEGQFKNGLREGKGVQYYSDGSIYNG
jgi:antitoxin component YwqK of YwqJK toxin-antitoxin module